MEPGLSLTTVVVERAWARAPSDRRATALVNIEAAKKAAGTFATVSNAAEILLGSRRRFNEVAATISMLLVADGFFLACNGYKQRNSDVAYFALTHIMKSAF